MIKLEIFLAARYLPPFSRVSRSKPCCKCDFSAVLNELCNSLCEIFSVLVGTINENNAKGPSGGSVSLPKTKHKLKNIKRYTKKNTALKKIRVSY